MREAIWEMGRETQTLNRITGWLKRAATVDRVHHLRVGVDRLSRMLDEFEECIGIPLPLVQATTEFRLPGPR